MLNSYQKHFTAVELTYNFFFIRKNKCMGKDIITHVCVVLVWVTCCHF